MKIRKELWFGFVLMALIVAAAIGMLLSVEKVTNGHIGLLMLSLVVVAIMLGFPTAFTLMGMGMLFTWLAYERDTTRTLDLMVQSAFKVMGNDVLIAVADDGLEDVARTREAHLLGDGQRRLPLPERAVQDEAAVGLHRAAEEDGNLGEVGGLGGQVGLFEQGREVHVQRPVDDDAQGALCVVLSNVDERLGEKRIIHRRHGNEKMIGQVDALHADHFNRSSPGDKGMRVVPARDGG